MNVLFLYNSTQTFTNTVYEHVISFARYSKLCYFFCHHDEFSEFNVDISKFDIIIVHYSIRLPYDGLSESLATRLEEFKGLKVLFIQDEYDHTYRAWYWIKRLGIRLVFTVVPENSIERIYPEKEFPDVRFINNLTGYVPEAFSGQLSFQAPSQREIIVGYRGRPLPVRYGKLGQEKIGVGKMVREYCRAMNIHHNIEWTEDARIYGPQWYEFMASCRAMLGSESGSNVFDWDGTLVTNINEFKKLNPDVGDEKIYRQFVEPNDIDGLMNQVSPRIFEAIAVHNVLVLFEGNYSGVVEPGVHYIALKKDGSNLDEVFARLNDADFVDGMTRRAYEEIVASGKYSYKSFVQMVDENIESAILDFNIRPRIVSLRKAGNNGQPSFISTEPLRYVYAVDQKQGYSILRYIYRAWSLLPDNVRNYLKPRIRSILNTK